MGAVHPTKRRLSTVAQDVGVEFSDHASSVGAGAGKDPPPRPKAISEHEQASLRGGRNNCVRRRIAPRRLECGDDPANKRRMSTLALYPSSLELAIGHPQESRKLPCCPQGDRSVFGSAAPARGRSRNRGFFGLCRECLFFCFSREPFAAETLGGEIIRWRRKQTEPCSRTVRQPNPRCNPPFPESPGRRDFRCAALLPPVAVLQRPSPVLGDSHPSNPLVLPAILPPTTQRSRPKWTGRRPSWSTNSCT